MSKSKRGLASVSLKRRREIASLGGKAVQASGKGHAYSGITAKAAGALGAQRLKDHLSLHLDVCPVEYHDFYRPYNRKVRVCRYCGAFESKVADNA